MRIIFCLPGRSYSGTFLERWTDTLIYLERSGVEVYLKRMWSSNVYLMRNMILRDDLEENPTNNAVPFSKLGGYDYLFWIDSDQIWSPKQIRKLVEVDVPIVCGVTSIGVKRGQDKDGNTIARAQSNVGYIREAGKAQFLWMDIISEMDRNDKGLIEVDFFGFGFVCIKEGVFESMSFPWFKPMMQEVPNPENPEGKPYLTFPSEDIGFCMRAKQEYGYELYVHPEIRVGHEKTFMV